MDIVEIVSQITGLNSTASESAIVSVLVVAIFYLLRIIYSFVKADSEQTRMESRLVSMAGSMIDENTKLREAYQKNVLVIEEHTAILKGIQQVLSTLNNSLGNINTDVIEIKHTILEDIQKSLLKNSKTTVVIKDVNDEVVVGFTISPEDDELVIRSIDLS